MKITFCQILIALLISGIAYSSPLKAQNILDKTVNVSLGNTSLLDVMYYLQKNNDVKFIYSKNSIDLSKKVSVNMENQTLRNVLDQLFKNNGIDYEVLKDRIILEKASEIAATIQVTGTVVDEKGLPLPGVSVLLEGTKLGAVTDVDGNYSIKVPDNGTLVFSFIGYITKKVPVNNHTKINIALDPDTKGLGEVVVVAFGKLKKTELVGSSTSITPSELKVPSSNLTTALAGKLAGVIAFQRSGEPGQDNASFFIRGVTTFGYNISPLILVDNIEVTANDLARMQPDDIASFTIMKDATSTSLYGARGANGVIVITTKEGKEGPTKVTLRIENSLSSNTQSLSIADPITYMKLANEAVLTRNPLGFLPYSQNKIDNTAAGTNPYLYPANDWMKQLINKNALTQRVNLNLSGGGKVSRYYIAGSYAKDNGILKVDQRNNFNSNIDLKSYQLRSNVNMDLTKTTRAEIRFAGSFDDYNGPIDGGAGMFNKILGSNPVLFPAFYPAGALPNVNHILFGNSGGTSSAGITTPSYINPYADMVKGYKDYTNSIMSTTFQLNQDFAFITPGLSAHMMFNTARTSYFDVSRFYNPYFYSANPLDASGQNYSLSLLNEGTATEYLNYNEGQKTITTTSYTEVGIDYSRQFGKQHVTGTLVGMRTNRLLANQGSLQASLPYRNQGISGRVNYAYDSRYMAEFNFGYNGSERFYTTHRYGFFPSVGIAWNVANEKFWNPMKSVVTMFKLRATVGMIGNDQIGSADDRFFYLSNVNMNDAGRGRTFGTNFDYSRSGVTIGRYANNDITWETARKTNFGADLSLFNGLDITADYFTENRTQILMDRSYIPTTMGLSAGVRANLGAAKARGVDISMDYKKTLGANWWMQGHVNYTYAHSEYVTFEEPNYPAFEKYLSHAGQPINQVRGFIAERLFIDDNDVANSPKQNYGAYGPGDIKYRDVNGDGQITDLDKVPIGNPTVPEIIYGAGLSVGYKSFDFSFFLQGSGRSSFFIDPAATAPFVSNAALVKAGVGGSTNALLKAYADDHWSEDNRNSYALWPRLSSIASGNNNQTSTWFMRNGAFVRLKSMEFGYSLPTKLISRVGLAKLRFYANGTNLFLLSGFKLWDIEMGGNGLGYPIQRVINAGVTANF